MRVLNLVTNDEARFFQQQVSTLESRGVESTTVAVPSPFVAGDGRRSVIDYLRLLPPTLRHSFKSYDLIHANSGLTAPAAVLQPNLPTVVSFWGTDLMGRYGPITQRFSHWCDEVIVMSEEMAAIYGDACHVIPHGVDLDRFQPVPRETALEAVGWDANDRHVLYPYPKARGVKDYPRTERLVERARERLDATVSLHTINGVPHEQMPMYMNAADVLVLTSKREGSPNAVKEALACGLPVVATRVGDVPERLAGVTRSVAADDDGALVDGLVSALACPERTNGREQARSVSITEMGDQLLEVYRTVTTD